MQRSEMLKDHAVKYQRITINSLKYVLSPGL